LKIEVGAFDMPESTNTVERGSFVVGWEKFPHIYCIAVLD
jgi:hypothetical protein